MKRMGKVAKKKKKRKEKEEEKRKAFHFVLNFFC